MGEGPSSFQAHAGTGKIFQREKVKK